MRTNKKNFLLNSKELWARKIQKSHHQPSINCPTWRHASKKRFECIRWCLATVGICSQTPSLRATTYQKALVTFLHFTSDRKFNFDFNLRRLMWFSLITFSRTRKATSRNPQSSFPSDGWRMKKNRRKTFIDSWVCLLGTEGELASGGGSPRLSLLFYCQRWALVTRLLTSSRQEIEWFNGNKQKTRCDFPQKFHENSLKIIN